MKKNVTYISHAALMSLVEASGLPVADKKNWTQVSGLAGKGRRMYVPKTKAVGRVDLVGLPDADGRRNLGGESFGSVTHQLDFSRTEVEVLEAFAAALAELRDLPAAEPRPRAGKAKAAPEPASSPEGRKAERLARIRLIAGTARKMGLPVAASSPALAADDEVSQEEIDAILSE